MAGVVWPTTVTLKTGTAPSCASAFGCGAGAGRVCAIAALPASPPTTNITKMPRLDMHRLSATSGPAWPTAFEDQIGSLRRPAAHRTGAATSSDHSFRTKTFRFAYHSPCRNSHVTERGSQSEVADDAASPW